ncbi:MAG: DEAD/DEAH box helicase [Oscillospiraceae bacterium]|nr:DEAD/DEAH box helicase [Oscillospiraceae bacterium]
MTFAELGLCAPILNALEQQGYKTPSPIQAKAIPPALAGRDVLGCAQTGTGKTCAFATPILQLLNQRKHDAHPIRALILTPTRELAIQIGESFDAYGKFLPLRTAVIFGGVGQNPQVQALQRGVDVLVATPGRLEDLYQQGFVDVSKLEIFVLDEADRMLDMGFIHDVKKILKWLPQKKQTLFFSATMPPEITQLVNSLLHDPVRVAVDPVSSPVEVIEQSVYFVDRGNKTKLIAHLMQEQKAKNALVFTRTKHGANKVARDLEKAGVTAAAIHGNKSQTARQQALSDFKAGRIRALVATDIAARGLDIDRLSHVFNYNLPDVPETYVHRIGRTGRAGRDGVAIALCDFSEKPLLKEIEKLIGKAVPVVENHPFPMTDFSEPVRDKHGKIVNAEDAEARQAARERSRERREAAKAAQEKAALEPTAPQPTEEHKKKKRRKKKKSAQSGQVTLQPVEQKPVEKKAAEKKTEPKPAPVERDSRPKLTRPGTRMDTGNQMPVVEFERPDPLAGDRIMDATARLLAPRSVTMAPAPRPKREEQRERNKNNRRRGKKPEKTAAASGQERKQALPKEEKKSGCAEQQPKQNKPVRQTPKQERDRRRSDRRGPDVSGRSRTKDSTQQASLMKPYYLNQDD